MKTKKELDVLKAEPENTDKKLCELNEDELNQVSGGAPCGIGQMLGEVEVSNFTTIPRSYIC